MSANWIEDVAEFHRAFGHPIAERCEWPDDERVSLRRRLVMEEWLEWQRALDDRDMEGAADAVADLIYVLVGSAVEFGIPLEAVWDAVQASNMAKLGPDGRPITREDGKTLKPEGWQPPDIARILREKGGWDG